MVLFDPRLYDWLISLAILAGSYVAARLVSFLLGRLLKRLVAHTPNTLDDRLLAAVKRPVTALLFLAGAYVAVHRLPLSPAVVAPIDGLLFILGATLVTLALIRCFGIAVDWYAGQSRVFSSDLAAEFTPLVSKMGKVFLVLVALIAVFQHFHINVASLVVSLGVGSLAVGLAAQDTLSNMFAGFTLLMDRPFRVGERIRLATGETGDVQSIGMRATHIKTLDETILIVPNSVLIKERLVNLSRPARSIGSSVEVALPYGVDIERAKSVLLAAAAGAEDVSPEPPPAVLVQRFGDWALHLVVGFHARDYSSMASARSEVQERAYRALQDAGIPIATAPAPGPVRQA